MLCKDSPEIGVKFTLCFRSGGSSYFKKVARSQLKLFLVSGRDTEHFRNDGDGQWIREVINNIHLATFDNSIEQLAYKCSNARFELKCSH